MCLESEAQRSKQWQVRPELHTHTRAHTRKWENHVDLQKLQLGWLKKPDIHTPVWPPGAEPVGPGLRLRAPSLKQSDLGTLTSLCPHLFSTITLHHLEGGEGGDDKRRVGACEHEMWGFSININNWLQKMQRIYYPSFQFSNETSLNIRHYMKHRLCFIWSADQCRLAAFMSHSIAVPGLLLYTKQ